MINVNLLPKNLRRVREPGYWRLLAVAFPVLVLAVAAGLQLSAERTVANLADQQQQLEDRLVLLQDAVREQRQLQQRLAGLAELIAVRDAVRENRIVWSGEIVSLLEHLPTGEEGGRPILDFAAMNMQALGAPTADPSRYEGRPAVAQITVNGTVANTEVLAEFVDALEASDDFGVAFDSASMNQDSRTYAYSVTIGALEGGDDETR